jgi:acetylornithine deacetylase/succinyl-diaminopimelate desuccinylase-like protein
VNDPVLAFLETEKPAIMERLLELVSVPSVSTDPAYEAGMAKTRDVLLERIRRMGFANVQTIEAGGHPAVYGEWLKAEDRPTLLVYGHYDVQPPDPLELWDSPPFEPDTRNERIYARGISDDKAPFSIALETIAAFLSVEGKLPFNIKILLEGEEEMGSATLEALFRNHRELLTVDAVLSADGARWRPDLNTVNIGSRGNAGFEFTVRTASKDLHSGRYGGIVPNALHVLSDLIASLHAIDGSVSVPGFYDGARDLTDADRQELGAIPFDEESFLDATGAKPLGEPGYSTLERLWLRPCLDVNGMWGGYTGPGGKTVIANQAFAKVTIRSVPGQDAEQVAQSVKDFLASRCPPGCTVSFGADRGHSAAYELPSEHPLLTAAEMALTETYGSAPYRIRIGGTLPLTDIVRRVLGVETVMLSFSIADEDYHAPNEFFRLSSIDEGLRTWTMLFRRLGETHAGEFSGFQRR